MKFGNCAVRRVHAERGRGMAWANWEATAATVAANAATAKHFDTNVGSPRWQQVERGQEGAGGGRGWRTYFTSAGDRKNANAQAKEGSGETGSQLGRQITNAIMKLI